MHQQGFNASTTNDVPPKTGILMLNMGGPSTLDEVEPFLKRLFSDRDLMTLPFQKYAAQMIAKRRSPTIRKHYEEIGGGSPIRRWTEVQGRAMVEQLNRLCPEFGPFKFYVAFRYANPLTEDAIDQLYADGCERAVAFSQYPQFSCSTTGSSLNAIARHVAATKEDASPIRWSVIDRWPTHPGLVEAFAERITAELEKFPPAERDRVVILFSAHSLPLKCVTRGDTYPWEISATADRVMHHLNIRNRYRVCWQSRVGPQAWITPSTVQTLAGLGRQRVKNVLLVPIAFVNDHIETLHELDIEYAHDCAQQYGIGCVRRAESLNDSAIFTRALAEVAKNHLVADEDSSTGQFAQRCPHCIYPSCAASRRFFLGEAAGEAIERKEC